MNEYRWYHSFAKHTTHCSYQLNSFMLRWQQLPIKSPISQPFLQAVHRHSLLMINTWVTDPVKKFGRKMARWRVWQKNSKNCFSLVIESLNYSFGYKQLLYVHWTCSKTCMSKSKMKPSNNITRRSFLFSKRIPFNQCYHNYP